MVLLWNAYVLWDEKFTVLKPTFVPPFLIPNIFWHQKFSQTQDGSSKELFVQWAKTLSTETCDRRPLLFYPWSFWIQETFSITECLLYESFRDSQTKQLRREILILPLPPLIRKTVRFQSFLKHGTVLLWIFFALWDEKFSIGKSW